ncbi:MAG: endonuclease domain-containing protein, partial [candidate division Zixibacteria bacterium]|nr:endonuclease domain-containing protein [candidate division Zixibacteria bacterium]
MTPAEKKIWYEVLRNRQFENLRWLRQRPIDNFIVDFYCAELKLILEIDGDSHFTEDNMIYDKERTKILEQYELTLIRFTNKEVMQNLSGVYQALLQQIAEK